MVDRNLCPSNKKLTITYRHELVILCLLINYMFKIGSHANTKPIRFLGKERNPVSKKQCGRENIAMQSPAIGYLVMTCYFHIMASKDEMPRYK